MALVLHAPLDETAAPVRVSVPALSDANRTMTVQGAPGFATGPDSGFSFDGENDGLFIGEDRLGTATANSFNNSLGHFSIYAKFRAGEAERVGDHFVQRWGWNGGYLAVYRTAIGGVSGYVKFGFYEQDGTHHLCERFLSGRMDGRLIEVLGVYDKVNMSLYIRVETDTMSDPTEVANTVTPWWGTNGTADNGWGIGVNGPFADSRWSGVVDDPRVWNHALTQEERDALFPTRPPFVQADDPAEGATITDAFPDLSFSFRELDTIGNGTVLGTGEVSQDPTFASGVIPVHSRTFNAPSTGWTITQPVAPLNAPGTWYWRIKVESTVSGLSSYSETLSFTFVPSVYLGTDIVGLKLGGSHISHVSYEVRPDTEARVAWAQLELLSTSEQSDTYRDSWGGPSSSDIYRDTWGETEQSDTYRDAWGETQ